MILEPPRDKTSKWHMRPEKTQISLGIRPVWSVFAVRMKKAWTLSYPLSAQQRLWSHWAHSKGWSESLLGAQSFCWFCHEAAHLSYRRTLQAQARLLLQKPLMFIHTINRTIGLFRQRATAFTLTLSFRFSWDGCYICFFFFFQTTSSRSLKLCWKIFYIVPSVERLSQRSHIWLYTWEFTVVPGLTDVNSAAKPSHRKVTWNGMNLLYIPIWGLITDKILNLLSIPI